MATYYRRIDSDPSFDNFNIYIGGLLLIFIIIASGLMMAWFGVDISWERSERKPGNTNSDTRITYIEDDGENINSMEVDTRAQEEDVKIDYRLYFYNIDAAKNISMATKDEGVRFQQSGAVRNVISDLEISPEFINDFSVVFINPDVDYGNTVLGIDKDGEQIIIPYDYQDDFHGLIYFLKRIILLDVRLHPNNVYGVFTHEIGHLIQNHLSDDQFIQFMQLSGYEEDVVDSWRVFLKNKNKQRRGKPLLFDNWAKNPGENFAEMFREIYAKKQDSSAIMEKVEVAKQNNKIREWFEKEVEPIYKKKSMLDL